MSSVFCLLCVVFVCPETFVIPKQSIRKEKVIINQQLTRPVVILIQNIFYQYHQQFFSDIQLYLRSKVIFTKKPVDNLEGGHLVSQIIHHGF